MERDVAGRRVGLPAQRGSVELRDAARDRGAAEAVHQEPAVALVPDVPVGCQLDQGVGDGPVLGGVGRLVRVGPHPRFGGFLGVALGAEVEDFQVPFRGFADHLEGLAVDFREARVERFRLGDGLPQRVFEDGGVDGAEDLCVLPDAVRPACVLRAPGRPQFALALGQGQSGFLLAVHPSPSLYVRSTRWTRRRVAGGRSR